MNAQRSSLVRLVVNFLPGLVLGVVCGGLLGAFFTPIAEAWSTRQPDPRPRTVMLASQNR